MQFDKQKHYEWMFIFINKFTAYHSSNLCDSEDKNSIWLLVSGSKSVRDKYTLAVEVRMNLEESCQLFNNGYSVSIELNSKKVGHFKAPISIFQTISAYRHCVKSKKAGHAANFKEADYFMAGTPHQF